MMRVTVEQKDKDAPTGLTVHFISHVRAVLIPRDPLGLPFLQVNVVGQQWKFPLQQIVSVTVESEPS